MATYQAPDALGNIVSVTTTVSNGTNTSPAVDCQREQLIGIIMPAGLDGDSITILGSADGVNFFPTIADSFGATSSGGALTYGFNASSYQIVLGFGGFAAPRWLQIQTLNSGSPQSQTADRVFTLVLRPQS